MGMQLRKSSPIGVLSHRIGESGIESLYDSFRPIDIKWSFGAEDSQIIDPVDVVGMAVSVQHPVQMGDMGPDHLQSELRTGIDDVSVPVMLYENA